MEPSGAYLHAHYSDGPFHPMDVICHNRDISGAWTVFIPDKSEGFTQAGVECLNDSIRTYVWAILGAQAQTRSNILKAGTGFDAQKQFLANVEDAIASPVDIPSSLARYQKTLQYASTPLDFVFGLGLYLAPSDMTLHPGNVQGYNEIVIVGSEAAIVHNLGINESEQMGKTTDDKSFEGKIAAPAGTDHKGPPSGRVTIHASHCCSATTRGCDKPRRREKGSHSSRVDPELAIVDPIFGAQPIIGVAYLVVETVNEALLLGLKFRLSSPPASSANCRQMH